MGWKERNSHCQCARLTPGYPGSPACEASWIERALLRLLPHFDIVKEIEGPNFSRHLTLYLRRFYLFKGRWIGLPRLGSLFLHHIFRSDDDPDPHTHPWPFWTFILKGSYLDRSWRWTNTFWWSVFYGRYEVFPPETVRRFAFRRRPADYVHKLELPPGEEAWTLVKTGSDRLDKDGHLDWGFLTKDGFVPWRKYLNVPEGHGDF